MALADDLQKRGISPQFWPPMDEKGNAAIRWRGRSRECSDSFATFKRRAGATSDGRDKLHRNHVAKKRPSKNVPNV